MYSWNVTHCTDNTLDIYSIHISTESYQYTTYGIKSIQDTIYSRSLYRKVKTFSTIDVSTVALLHTSITEC